MRKSTTSARRAAGLLGATAVSGVLALIALTAPTVLTVPIAAAQPDQCTAGGLASTASGVLNEVGTYLGTHPDANNVLTAAASQTPDDARNSVRGYFTGHVGELLDLQRIAQPLADVKNQCGVALSPSHLATLVETIAGG